MFRGYARWNGVAIASRTPPAPTRTALFGNPADVQSRYIEAAIRDVLTGGPNLPNSNPRPGQRFGYKSDTCGAYYATPRPARGAYDLSRRLHRGADRRRHPQHAVLAQKRAIVAGAARPVCRASRAGMDRCPGRDALERHTPRLGARRGLWIGCVLISPGPCVRAAGVDQDERSKPGAATTHRRGWRYGPSFATCDQCDLLEFFWLESLQPGHAGSQRMARWR